MAIKDVVKRGGRGLALAAALVGAVSLTAAPSTAHADHGGIGPGAAVGLGLGAFALGAAVGSSAYGYPYQPYGYYPPAAYYPPPGYSPGYYPPAPAPRSCWDPYYRRYYAC
jgi:hypothetical protein